MDAVLDRLNEFFDRVFAWGDSLPVRPTNRVVGLLMGAPAWTVLGIAASLTPSVDGVGTHKQLGLNGCLMLTQTGWPCPMCGMTTTFSLMAHGRVFDALKNQPFGPVLFSLTVLFAVVGLYDLVTAKGLYRRVWAWAGRREQGLAIALLVGMILGWIYKSVIMHPAMFHLA